MDENGKSWEKQLIFNCVNTKSTMIWGKPISNNTQYFLGSTVRRCL